MKYAGGTFSGVKLVLCILKFPVMEHCCTYEGWIPDEKKVAVIKNWGLCNSLTGVHAFLGIVGVLCIFIRNFAHQARDLVKLIHKAASFEFGGPQLAAQHDLKQVVLSSPALQPTDYISDDAR